MLQHFAKHHNKIQFFGYEVANLVLVAQQLWRSDGSPYGLNPETLAALETARGGRIVLDDWINEQRGTGTVPLAMTIHGRVAAWSLNGYCQVVGALHQRTSLHHQHDD
jgi:hypothetical protein